LKKKKKKKKIKKKKKKKKKRAILNTFKGFKRKHREQNSSRLAEKKPSTFKNRKHSF
jgi:hypothetical protein